MEETKRINQYNYWIPSFSCSQIASYSSHRGWVKLFAREFIDPALKIQVVHVTEETAIDDADNNAMLIVDGTMRYVRIGRVSELVFFLVSKRMAKPAKLKCDYCEQFVECIYPKTRLIGTDRCIDSTSRSVLQKATISGFHKLESCLHFKV